MAKQIFGRETERNFALLDQRLGELTQLCEALSADNRALRAKHAELLKERAALLDSNRQTQARIDAMVARLKGLEETS